MTREEYINFANCLKNNYTIDFDVLPEFCDMAISAVKWIPVTEKLPENGQYVLCSLSAECGSKHNIVINAFEEGREYWYDGKIEAWMPLPEPYKGGGV